MMKLPVVSVLGEGVVEYLTISKENIAQDGVDVGVRGMALSSDAEQQLRLARKVAQFFLSRPYVKPLAVDSLEQSKIVVESNTGDTYEGPSFGLAFLAGCLALGLNVPLRGQRLFSAALADGIQLVGMPGGGVRLGHVGKIGEKLSAACVDNHSRIYLRSENEREILVFEQGFWRQDVGRSCLPYALPELVSTAAVAAMSLDPKELLEKVLSTLDGTAFLLLMFTVGGELYEGASLVDGIGSCLAQLRRDGRLDKVAFLDGLLRDLGIRYRYSAHQLLLCFFNRCIAACSADSTRTEAVKAVISHDPQLPLVTVPDHTYGNRTASENADLDVWLGRESFDDLREFLLAPAVLRICSQLAPDFEGYWPKTGTLILNSLSRWLERVVELSETGQQVHAEAVLSAILESGFAESVGRLNPRLVGEAKDIVRKFVGQMGGLTAGKVPELASTLYIELAGCQVPEVLIEVAKKQQPVLTLTFRILGRRYAPRPWAKPAFYPRPPLCRINDLELVITGPGQLSLCVPSPVLLVEHCRTQHYRFCRRRDMTLAEDTLNHYPENDAVVVRGLFDNRNCNVIGFQVLDGEEALPASVRWLSHVNTWPPAIDSQFLAASIASSREANNPRRLVDVGCGTGYLAIVAAHRWRSLQELHLVDIDALAVAAARYNIMDDPIACKLNFATYWQGFNKFKEENFDILLCAPPYLPERPFPVSGIEVSTNGTVLLEEVVERGSAISKEVWVVFSVLAWPEFQRALARVPTSYRSIEILRREFVPLRITWLEPIPPEDGGDIGTFNERRKYYEKVLLKRGLIDMEGPDDWGNYLQEFSLQLPSNCSADLVVYPQAEDLEKTLDVIKQDSRGYRFWHEVRVLRMTSA
jgi:SAM-dependent methyltransferase